MKESQRTSRFVELKDYNINGKGDHFLVATQWSNGEGFDVYLSRDHQWLSMTWDELTALHAALGDWVEQPADVCPHIVSTTDGSNYCKLGLKTLLHYAGETL